jgi:hypothetical protein
MTELTEQELQAQIMVALSPDGDEAKSKAAFAAVVAHGLKSLQRIAEALESPFEIETKA